MGPLRHNVKRASEGAFIGVGFCFGCGLIYLGWRARNRVQAVDLAASGHLPNADLDDDPLD
jgi:hypothetical protein